MKRIWSFVLAAVLLAGMCACNKNAEASWQEQYDLGLRYLSEGKYEEAVLAFNAAIEIDPKQPAAYIGLADAYTALGDTAAAVNALRQGLAAVGENQELSDKLAELDGAADDPAEGLPEEEPVNAYGATSFSRRRDYRSFDSMTGEQQAVVEAAVNAAVAQDPAALGQTLGDTKVFENRGGENYSAQFYTFWNGYKISLRFREEVHGPDDAYIPNALLRQVVAEVRPENGTGYWVYCDAWTPADHSVYSVIVCPCVDWQWNGEAIIVTDTADGRMEFRGTAKDNLREGTFTDSRYAPGQSEAYSVSEMVYRDGYCVEIAGEAVTPEGLSPLTGGTYPAEEMDMWLRDYLFW